MKQELKSGIPEFDNAVEQFENGEINFLELTCRLWNTAYAMGKSEQLNLPLVSNNEVAAMENHYAYACKLACDIVEKMARQILSEQKQLDEFVMAMGTYFFTYKSKKRKGETLDPYITLMNSSFNYYVAETEPFFKPLSDFISEWDSVLKITGEPMRFTAKGEKVTDW